MFLVFDIIGILTTGSRGPLAFTIVGIGIFYFGLFKEKLIGKKTFERIIVVLFVFVFSVLIMLIFPNLKGGF